MMVVGVSPYKAYKTNDKKYIKEIKSYLGNLINQLARYLERHLLGFEFISFLVETLCFNLKLFILLAHRRPFPNLQCLWIFANTTRSF